jgi:hypothetical protein
MRIFTLIMSAVLLTLLSTRVTAADKPRTKRLETCHIVTEFGTAIGQGKTHDEAAEQAHSSCGTQILDKYFAQRREVPDDVKEDLALACANLECH